ncbi:ceroid-lipofuscinosis [Anaeramoeba flamelloides]|uniref:Ceroid-lipofuscinosis n=1 Tax=Anaeramoeba flamelloides TaxID=1746091 RepID=A0ABQ8ZFH5_9EUKA|nr:ceroid-lipofuscinosis [Anaeramoeba flamelloides]
MKFCLTFFLVVLVLSQANAKVFTLTDSVNYDDLINVYLLKNEVSKDTTLTGLINYDAALGFSSEEDDDFRFHLHFRMINNTYLNLFPQVESDNSLIWRDQSEIYYEDLNFDNWDTVIHIGTIDGGTWNHYQCWPNEYIKDNNLYNIWNVFNSIECGSQQYISSNSEYEFIWRSFDALTLFDAEDLEKSEFRSFISLFTHYTSDNDQSVEKLNSPLSSTEKIELATFYRYTQDKAHNYPDLLLSEFISQTLEHFGNIFYVRSGEDYYRITFKNDPDDEYVRVQHFSWSIPYGFYSAVEELNIPEGCFPPNIGGYNFALAFTILPIILIFVGAFYFSLHRFHKTKKERKELNKFQDAHNINLKNKLISLSSDELQEHNSQSNSSSNENDIKIDLNSSSNSGLDNKKLD